MFIKDLEIYSILLCFFNYYGYTLLGSICWDSAVSQTGIGINESVSQHIPLAEIAKIQAPLDDSAPASAVEQREVTVAFADIRGFTTLADCMPPEELATVLNTYLSAVTRVFLKHDVIINRFGGGSIMAVWNAPADCKRHPLRVTMLPQRRKELFMNCGKRNQHFLK